MKRFLQGIVDVYELTDSVFYPLNDRQTFCWNFFPQCLQRLKLIPDQCPDFICKSLLTTYWAPPPLNTSTAHSYPQVEAGEWWEGASFHTLLPPLPPTSLPKSKTTTNPPVSHCRRGRGGKKAGRKGEAFVQGSFSRSREAVKRCTTLFLFFSSMFLYQDLTRKKLKLILFNTLF